jgi:hypothetical protein
VSGTVAFPDPDGRRGSGPRDRRASFLDPAGAPVPLGDIVAGASAALRPVVLLDGRSGTGKTTLAGVLAGRLGAQLVHLDDLYPGWDGLRAASEAVVAEVLAAPPHIALPLPHDPPPPPIDRRAGTAHPGVPDVPARPRWRRFDWGTGLQAEWHALDATRPLVVEGCGALSRDSAPLATFRIWLDGDDAARKQRALDRDGETFAREWERWARQEDAFIAAEDPRSLADRVLHLPS